MPKDHLAGASEGSCCVSGGRVANRWWKQALDPYAQHYAAMYDMLHAASDRELMELIEACELPSETNCSWCTYDAAKYIAGQAKGELGVRERALAAEKAAAAILAENAGAPRQAARPDEPDLRGGAAGVERE